MRLGLTLRSIRHKLLVGVLVTTMTALLISGAILILYDLDEYRENTWIDLRTQADLIGQASVAALQFQDPQTAGETLALLHLRPRIRAAILYDAEGNHFAQYLAAGQPPETLPQAPGATGFRIAGERVHLVRSVLGQQDEPLGSLYLQAEYPFAARLTRETAVVLGVAALALALAMLLALWIQARITRPILQVTALAHRVVERRDYSLRARQTSDDETGYLVEAFNDLLSQIESRTSELEASNRQLEREIGERTEAERALRESELRHRTLVTTLTAVVWRTDAGGDFLAAQTSWDNFTGQTPDSHRGQGWLEAFHVDDREPFRLLWHQATEEGAPFERILRLWHQRRREYRYVNLRAVPLPGRDGRPREWMGIVDDIHERVQSSEEIRRLNSELERRVAERTAELENANKELESFSYSVSHDLRAPLRSIDGFSQALLEDYRESLDDTGRDYLDRVRAAAQRMGVLIDDLLNLSRVSRTELDRQPLDLTAMAEQLAAELRDGEPERQLEWRISPGLQGRGDPRLIRLVLQNLLHNAWKYTGRCPAPRIEVGATDAKGRSCFFVRDNGAGFDMAYADRLFGPFQRLHDAREFPGTGVGLATVQRIVRRHGGDVWAQAKPGDGATFFFTLPQGKETSHAQLPDSAGRG